MEDEHNFFGKRKTTLNFMKMKVKKIMQPKSIKIKK